jgi:hypothetical protein
MAASSCCAISNRPRQACGQIVLSTPVGTAAERLRDLRIAVTAPNQFFGQIEQR